MVAAAGIPLMTGLLIKKLAGFWRRLLGNVAEESAEPFSAEARLALGRLGMGESQLRSFAAGEPVAFNLPGANPGLSRLLNSPRKDVCESGSVPSRRKATYWVRWPPS